jgi:hypothetical protein
MQVTIKFRDTEDRDNSGIYDSDISYEVRGPGQRKWQYITLRSSEMLTELLGPLDGKAVTFSTTKVLNPITSFKIGQGAGSLWFCSEGLRPIFGRVPRKLYVVRVK